MLDIQGAEIFTSLNEGELEGEDLLISKFWMILSISSGVIGDRKMDFSLGDISLLILLTKFSSNMSIFLDKVSPMHENIH